VLPSHARTSLERAFELKGLDGMATYQLALGSGGSGAYTQGVPKGPVRKVACARKTSDGPIKGRILDEFSHGQQFLVSEGSPVEVRGASTLWCGFIDDVDPRDNQGEMELFITQVATEKPRERGSESPERLHADAQALMRKQQFAEAERVIEKCIEADPSFALCYQLMAISKARRSKMDEGARYYRKFVELAPDHPSTPAVKKMLLEYDRQRR
jgi:serine/threonine-protein kinase